MDNTDHSRTDVLGENVQLSELSSNPFACVYTLEECNQRLEWINSDDIEGRAMRRFCEDFPLLAGLACHGTRRFDAARRGSTVDEAYGFIFDEIVADGLVVSMTITRPAASPVLSLKNSAELRYGCEISTITTPISGSRTSSECCGGCPRILFPPLPSVC